MEVTFNQALRLFEELRIDHMRTRRDGGEEGVAWCFEGGIILKLDMPWRWSVEIEPIGGV